MVADQDRDRSEFNMAVSYLNRLNYLFYIANEASMQLDAYGWFHALLALYRELSTEMKPEELKLATNYMTNITPLLSIQLQRQHSGQTQTIPADLYNKLHTFEIMLRRVMKDSGLLTKLVDDAAQALR